LKNNDGGYKLYILIVILLVDREIWIGWNLRCVASKELMVHFWLWRKREFLIVLEVYANEMMLFLRKEKVS